jgi:HSP20 family molecular chaperone IbpA
MAIIRWNPWNIDRFFEDEWDLPTIPGISRLAGQGLNIYETDTNIIAEAALPGVPDNNIDVTIDEDGIVRVTGSYEETEEDKDRRRYYMSSMAQSFNYSFRLPKGANTQVEPSCELTNGVLKMTFPKTEKQAPKKIKISRGDTNQQQSQQQAQEQKSQEQQSQQQAQSGDIG